MSAYLSSSTVTKAIFEKSLRYLKFFLSLLVLLYVCVLIFFVYIFLYLFLFCCCFHVNFVKLSFTTFTLRILQEGERSVVKELALRLGKIDGKRVMNVSVCVCVERGVWRWGEIRLCALANVALPVRRFVFLPYDKYFRGQKWWKHLVWASEWLCCWFSMCSLLLCVDASGRRKLLLRFRFCNF